MFGHKMEQAKSRKNISINSQPLGSSSQEGLNLNKLGLELFDSFEAGVGSY